MRTREEAVAACMRLAGVYEDYPFDDFNWTVMRHEGSRKMFAAIFQREGSIWLNLKAEPLRADLWRSVYPSVIPAYHMNKTHWISVILDGSLSDAEILPLIDDSYALTLPRAPKKKVRRDDEC